MIVTLLTDYGRDDDFVGVCHGVIRGIHPEAQIVDITHGVRRYAVRQGALVLRNTVPYMPVGVHVAVVDPQVGTERRALALRTGGRAHPGRPRQRAAEPGVAAVRRDRPGGGHHPLAAPARAGVGHLPRPRHLRAGRRPPRTRGGARGRRRPARRIGAADRRGCRSREWRRGHWSAHALVVDRFGNASLNVDHDDMAGTDITLGSTVELEVAGERYLATYAQTFADVQPRRDDRLRGRLPHARGGDQPRRRGRHAGRAARTPKCACGRDDRPPPRPLPGDRLHQRAGSCAGGRGRPARHARDGG